MRLPLKKTYFLWTILLSSTLANAADYDGLLEPYRIVHVSSAVTGVLDAVLVERGDRVRKGQVIARLKSGVERANVNLAKVHYEYSIRKLSRNRTLIKKKLISESDRDKLETDAQVADAELNVARQKLSLLTIRSPVTGVVMERQHSAGEFVRNDEIAQLAQVDPLNIEVILPASMLTTVKMNMELDVSIGAPLNKTLKAKIVIIDPVVDAASNTIGVRLNLPNEKLAIPAGLKCKVHIPD